jgi:hypothetical protein
MQIIRTDTSVNIVGGIFSISLPFYAVVAFLAVGIGLSFTGFNSLTILSVFIAFAAYHFLLK